MPQEERYGRRMQGNLDRMKTLLTVIAASTEVIDPEMKDAVSKMWTEVKKLHEECLMDAEI
ncbi:hypothetical protein [Arsenicibacter rosenii]|uniref:Uncharacterized protein n=1 Tax=Arsenicibacter rosenii TaxID=1750698 RepID=A0A1S2VBE9_9BACT|nr:hypothetical protein [Arsenicibacter rosenii]OIN55635.1 hypothetical protein BLX24_29055 [Arsenicibacter rosenii]